VQVRHRPAIDEGFYYDFLLPEGFTFSPEILQQIANEMKTIIKQEYGFERQKYRTI
jgi:threonyl-tRNA synthetase